jgi:hypothetical protein
MAEARTFFEQVPVETVKRIGKEQSLRCKESRRREEVVSDPGRDRELAEKEKPGTAA